MVLKCLLLRYCLIDIEYIAYQVKWLGVLCKLMKPYLKFMPSKILLRIIEELRFYIFFRFLRDFKYLKTESLKKINLSVEST